MQDTLLKVFLELRGPTIVPWTGPKTYIVENVSAEGGWGVCE